MPTLSVTYALRRDTAANWTSVNPVLADGEPGVETDTGRIKVGDGTTAWSALTYAVGDTGPAGTIAIGTVTTLPPSAPATVTNTGTPSAAVLDIGLPQGAQGDPGTDGNAATIAIGTVTTGAAGTSASVANSGTSSAAVLDITIPRGNPGDPGDSGAAATIAVGTVSTLAAGASPTVANSGTASAAVFDFGIPAGAPGAAGSNGTNGTNGTDGEDGAAATVSVGTVSTLAAGSPATVANVGTANAAVLDFGIPQGAAGAPGGGSSPAVFYALGDSTADPGGALATLSLAAATISATGFTQAGGEITIGPELNGRTALFDYGMGITGAANNRIELRIELQLDPDGASGFSIAKGPQGNYAARNNAQNTGGVNDFHAAVLATGQVWRVQGLRDGVACTLVPNATSLRIVAL